MTAYEVSLYRDKFQTRPYPLVRQP
jgi:hypothetical protein